MDIFKILTIPGLIAALVAGFVALILSVRNQIALKKIEEHKVKLAFTRDKLDILREAREKTPASFNLLMKSNADMSDEDYSEFYYKLREIYFERVSAFEEVRFCILKERRDLMDRIAQDFKDTDFKVQKHRVGADSSDITSATDNYSKLINIMIQYIGAFSDSLGETMDILSDQLS